MTIYEGELPPETADPLPLGHVYVPTVRSEQCTFRNGVYEPMRRQPRAARVAVQAGPEPEEPDPWCDDCLGYTHRADCPSAKLPEPQSTRNAVQLAEDDGIDGAVAAVLPGLAAPPLSLAEDYIRERHLAHVVAQSGATPPAEDEAMRELNATALHEMRCLLYEDGWDSVGQPQERLRAVLQRWQETRDANRRLTAEVARLREERQDILRTAFEKDQALRTSEADRDALREGVRDAEKALLLVARYAAGAYQEPADVAVWANVRRAVESALASLRALLGQDK